jgi:hypothetical protein
VIYPTYGQGSDILMTCTHDAQMPIQTYGRPVDGTIPVPALLYDDEDLVASQDSVGIYSGCDIFSTLVGRVLKRSPTYAYDETMLRAALPQTQD